MAIDRIEIQGVGGSFRIERHVLDTAPAPTGTSEASGAEAPRGSA